MASIFGGFFGKRGQRYDKSIAPDMLERICGGLALVLLAFALTAVFKGRHDWPAIPAIIWAHLGTVLVALAITPVLLWRKRGDKFHRSLGWIWCVSMFATALLSFGLRLSNSGGFSLIHILSVITVIGVPVVVLSARRHDISRHRRQVRGFVIGALLVAGFFTFPFNRLLGHWLFG